MTNDPVLIAYTVKRSSAAKRPIWTRIGRAYPHDTGAGLTVVLDAMPLDGRIVLLELDDADDRDLIKDADMPGKHPSVGRKQSAQAPKQAKAKAPRE